MAKRELKDREYSANRRKKFYETQVTLIDQKRSDLCISADQYTEIWGMKVSRNGLRRFLDNESKEYDEAIFDTIKELQNLREKQSS